MPCATIVRLLLLPGWALPLAMLAAQSPDAGSTRHAAMAIPASPITSRAALDAYLRDAPPAQSPLNWLTPGARCRFLGSPVYRERGLGSLSLADLRYELTREQAHTVGAQSYAIDLDVLTTPRAAADGSAASMLEPAYERLLTATARASARPARDRPAALMPTEKPHATP